MEYKNKPILTVGIPTYKRPETLEKIIKQLMKEKNQNFILLIADDSMDDNTANMIGHYSKIMPNLVYSKNKKNLGFSGNVANLYKIATTRYIWFLCDDDEVIPGAIDNILKAINQYSPVVAVFNSKWIDPLGRFTVAGVKKNIIHNDINHMDNYQPLMRTTYLSILVVERRLSIKKLLEKEYKDNIFFQIPLSLFLLSEKFNFCEINSAIVLRKVGFKYGEFFKFYMVDHLKAVTMINHKFDNKKFVKWSINHIPTAFQVYISQKIGLFKYNGKPSKRTLLALVNFYGPFSVLISMFVVLYYLIPSWFIKFIYKRSLIKIHGFKKGIKIYNMNVDRAFTDRRQTGFTSYR